MSNPTNKGRGVLQINAAATRKPAKQAPRQPAPRLRLIVRRLPPGLTENEFWSILSTEWHVGKGKVDWAAFKAGKISKDLAKPSRPARAYLKVKDSAHLEPLSQHIRTTNFQDSKNSFRDSCLIGPPSLEFAPYNKIPGGRARHDGRQGTIDQDPEFIDFLQSLTEPIVKPSANGDSVEAKSDKVAITPLVQYIKEKKANKAKEKEAAAVAKAGKKTADVKETKETKEKSSASGKNEQRSTVVKKTANTEAEKARVAKATQDAMTAINRSVAAMKGKPAPEKSETTTPTPQQPTPSPQSTPRRERRGDASAAARIIGRDLGLTPKEGRTPRSSRNNSTPTSAQQTPASPATSSPATTTTPKVAIPATPPPQVPQSPSKNSAPAQAPTGPRNLRNATPQQQPQQRANQTPNTPKSTGKPPPQPSTGAKSAFLKHANPSQGVTEELLRSTFATYGTITRCEIDKKKGLGYIDFTEAEALRKAMAASPVKVGNGSVVVLENRTPYRKISQTPSRPGTASPAVSATSSPRPTNATMASITETVSSPQAIATPQIIQSTPVDNSTVTETSAPPTPIATSATPTADSSAGATASPSTPRGSGRHGGRGHNRGNRGGNRGRGANAGGQQNRNNNNNNSDRGGNNNTSKNSTNNTAKQDGAVPADQNSGNSGGGVGETSKSAPTPTPAPTPQASTNNASETS